ncbi:hypothetical protein HDZ31DRAFT_37618 [Schizophyllum fasciatum]
MPHSSKHTPQLPVPEMRFEQKYLTSIAPYIHTSYTPVAEHESSLAVEDHLGGAYEKVEVKEKRRQLVKRTEVQWGHLLLRTTFDQVISPMLQGLVLAVLGHWITPIVQGVRSGVKTRVSHVEGSFSRGLRSLVSGLVRLHRRLLVRISASSTRPTTCDIATSTCAPVRDEVSSSVQSNACAMNRPSSRVTTHVLASQFVATSAYVGGLPVLMLFSSLYWAIKSSKECRIVTEYIKMHASHALSKSGSLLCTRHIPPSYVSYMTTFAGPNLVPTVVWCRAGSPHSPTNAPYINYSFLSAHDDRGNAPTYSPCESRLSNPLVSHEQDLLCAFVFDPPFEVWQISAAANAEKIRFRDFRSHHAPSTNHLLPTIMHHSRQSTSTNQQDKEMRRARRHTVYDLTALNLHEDGSRLDLDGQLTSRRALVQRSRAVRDARGNVVARGLPVVPHVKRVRNTEEEQGEGEEHILLDEVEEADPSVAGTTGGTDGASAPSRKRRRLNQAEDLNLGANVSELDELPSGDLLKCIHHFASRYYAERGMLLNASKDYRRERKERRQSALRKAEQSEGEQQAGEKQRNENEEADGSEEHDNEEDTESGPPVKRKRRGQAYAESSKLSRDMYKVMDGSALMALGLLLQEHVAQTIGLNTSRKPAAQTEGIVNEIGEAHEREEMIRGGRIP